MVENVHKVKIGCDPEVFIFDALTKGFVCAEGYVPGTKQQPHSFTNGMVQVDGFAAEFGITPCITEDGFVRRVSRVMERVERIVQKKGPHYKLVVKPTAVFSKKVLDEAPEHSKVLGCDPDYNAYTLRENPRPNADKLDFRTGGGHVHIGWTKGVDTTLKGHHEDCAALSKQLDIYLGVPSMLWDRDTKRRELYGSPGSYRPKPYGMEYRALSNSWLKHETLVRFVFKQTVKAYNQLLEGVIHHNLVESARTAIQKDDLYAAMWICDQLGFDVPRPPAGMSVKDKKEAA